MENKRTLSNRLTTKYLLIIRNEENFAEKRTYTFTYTRILLSLLLIFIAMFVMSFYMATSLLEQWFDPRYAELKANQDVVDLTLKLDSLIDEVAVKDKFIGNFKMIMSGREDEFVNLDHTGSVGGIEQKDLAQSKVVNPIDSQFRREFEGGDVELDISPTVLSQDLQEFYLFRPVEGIVSDNFNPKINHMGIDIVAKQDEPVKSVADGTVVFSSWTQDTGFVIAIQHRGNLISMYKHNSDLLKNVGSFVTAGEVISIIGNTGELTSGPHLHFELWYNGNPINPEEFIRF